MCVNDCTIKSRSICKKRFWYFPSAKLTQGVILAAYSFANEEMSSIKKMLVYLMIQIDILATIQARTTSSVTGGKCNVKVMLLTTVRTKRGTKPYICSMEWCGKKGEPWWSHRSGLRYFDRAATTVVAHDVVVAADLPRICPCQR